MERGSFFIVHRAIVVWTCPAGDQPRVETVTVNFGLRAT